MCIYISLIVNVQSDHCPVENEKNIHWTKVLCVHPILGINYWSYEINSYVCLAFWVTDIHPTCKKLKRCSDLDLWLLPDNLTFAPDIMNTSGLEEFPPELLDSFCLSMESTIRLQHWQIMLKELFILIAKYLKQIRGRYEQ